MKQGEAYPWSFLPKRLKYLLFSKFPGAVGGAGPGTPCLIAKLLASKAGNECYVRVSSSHSEACKMRSPRKGLASES